MTVFPLTAGHRLLDLKAAHNAPAAELPKRLDRLAIDDLAVYLGLTHVGEKQQVLARLDRLVRVQQGRFSADIDDLCIGERLAPCGVADT